MITFYGKDWHILLVEIILTLWYNRWVEVNYLTKTQKEEFESIIKDIENNNNFRELDNELHHGISRYGHSYRVAKGVYIVTKNLGFSSYIDATRAALLHDFYFNYQLEEKNNGKKFIEHPTLALLNASKYYTLSDMQKNMIESHMFPTCKVLPKYKESICLTLVDKVVALYEMQRYKLGMKLGVYLLFVLNMITLQK